MKKQTKLLLSMGAISSVAVGSVLAVSMSSNKTSQNNLISSSSSLSMYSNTNQFDDAFKKFQGKQTAKEAAAKITDISTLKSAIGATDQQMAGIMSSFKVNDASFKKGFHYKSSGIDFLGNSKGLFSYKNGNWKQLSDVNFNGGWGKEINGNFYFNAHIDDNHNTDSLWKYDSSKNELIYWEHGNTMFHQVYSINPYFSNEAKDKDKVLLSNNKGTWVFDIKKDKWGTELKDDKGNAMPFYKGFYVTGIGSNPGEFGKVYTKNGIYIVGKKAKASDTLEDGTYVKVADQKDKISWAGMVAGKTLVMINGSMWVQDYTTGKISKVFLDGPSKQFDNIVPHSMYIRSGDLHFRIYNEVSSSKWVGTHIIYDGSVNKWSNTPMDPGVIFHGPTVNGKNIWEATTKGIKSTTGIITTFKTNIIATSDANGKVEFKITSLDGKIQKNISVQGYPDPAKKPAKTSNHKSGLVIAISVLFGLLAISSLGIFTFWNSKVKRRNRTYNKF